MSTAIAIAPAKGKLGILLVGLGAVSTTTIAGVFAIRKGLAKPIGSLTQMGTLSLSTRVAPRAPAPTDVSMSNLNEIVFGGTDINDDRRSTSDMHSRKICDVVPLAALDDIVFGGWDIFQDNGYEAATHAGVLDDTLLAHVKDELESVTPMSAVFDRQYVKRLDGPNIKKGRNKKDLADQLIADIRRFKADHDCDRIVVIWAGSTEVFQTEAPCHASLAAFEQGLLDSDPAIASSMIYAYAAIREGLPYGNAAPNLSAEVPALQELAAKTGSPICGNDMKTGQTLIKTVIAPGLKARMLGVHGWYSTNILGNRDGEVLDDPESFKTKEESKKGALDYIFQPHLYPDLYKDIAHVVRINYYPPRGDNKEGWDNIDIFGWLGYPMQLKINIFNGNANLANDPK